jgi:molybdate-binding protein/DNA-binding transcriptional regulator YhcF (GntR family)
MDNTPLYQQIVEAIRSQVLSGALQPGDRLPSVRAMTETWNCTPGTVQRAYADLARQGMVVSRAGQGTHVVGGPSGGPSGGARRPEGAPLRKAALVQRASAFLLETLTAGYAPDEIESAVRLALDQWRVISVSPANPAPQGVLRFAGSNDLALAWLAAHFPEIAPGFSLELGFSGSLRGLMALAEGSADLAGCHLYDTETGEYNLPFVRRLLPGRAVRLVTLAHRRQGLMLAPGNPLEINSLRDLLRREVRFINRQPGSGTRVWLDSALNDLEIPCTAIQGYDNEVSAHTEAARAVAEGRADAALGLESAALAYGLDFVFLLREPYELVIPEEALDQPAMQKLLVWLVSKSTQEAIHALGGYEVEETGKERG